MSLQTYRLQNKCLCKCLKSHISVDSKSLKMLKGPKNCCNMHDSFTSFVYHLWKISVAKSLF